MPIGESSRSFNVSEALRKSEDSERSREATDSYIGAKGKRPEYQRPRGFWPRILRHFQRYFLCYGLLGVIFLAIFLPVFFLVILPAIAQRLVDDASVPIESVLVLNPTPNGVTFSLSASLNVPLGLAVRVDTFNLSLFNREVKPRTPYVTVPLESIHLKGKSNITISNQTIQIQDQDQFTSFLATAVYSKRFTLSVYGKTTAHLGKLKIPLTLDKDVELNGLDMLRGFSIDSASLALPPKADGSNLIGEATIPNYSIVTFALGNVTLDLKIGDMILGNGTIYNVLLSPGNNTIPLRGILDIPAAIKNIGPIMTAETSALSEGNLMLSASGHSTIYHGLHIPYFEKVLNNLTVTANMPILKVLLGTISGLVSSNPGVIQNVTAALQGTDLSTGPYM